MRSPQTGKKIRLPLGEYLKSIPEMVGIRLNEEPPYQVMETDGDIEVRRYEPMATATVSVPGMGEQARAEAFRRLAAYIFGENLEQRTLPMTAPVLEDGAHTMTFILPRKALTEGLPQPIDPSIKLATTGQQLIAAIRYRGEDSEERYIEHRERLLAWLGRQRRYQTTGAVFSAAYDPPASLDATKRNEVQVTLTSVQ